MLTNDKFLKVLGEYLKELRIQSHLTQRDIANAMGYTSPQFISNWERGLTAPPISTIRKLLDIYACDPDEVFDFIAGQQLDILRKELLEPLPKN